MNRLSTKDRVAVVAALVEGNSIRATVRMTGVAKNTVVKLLADLGVACATFADKAIRGVAAKRIQCDEIWGFCYAKAKNVPEDKKGQDGFGDVWTWTAIDADTKLVLSWHVGQRDHASAIAFCHDLARRVTDRAQVSTDGLAAYRFALSDAFGGKVDHGVVRKTFGVDRSGSPGRYSPPVCTGCETEAVRGDPDPAHISTSYVERNNLTMRMGMRRLTRLTNGFSKKLANLEHAVSLHFVHYNFCRPHASLRKTPAMAAGLADHRWSLEELVGLLAATEGGSK